MIVYSYDRVSGIYTGQTEADPSPLEPGVWLMPANTTDQEPPNPREGFNRVFDGVQWKYVEIVVPEMTDEMLIQNATAKRQLLLIESDYTQLPDVQATMTDAQKTAWIEYRQALRDVPEQDGYPREIAWPIKPE